MNRDITFCNNDKCVRKDTCKRYTPTCLGDVYYILHHNIDGKKCKLFLKKEKDS